MTKILVIGGGGYCGTELVNNLSKSKKNFVSVYDTFWFGNKIIKRKNIKIFKNDIRNLKKLEKAIKGQDIIIHLACISNDPMYEINPNLSKQINYDCFEDCVKLSKKYKIKRFIYASSSSVYGLSKKNNVREDHPLRPLTDYSKYKAKCEKILLQYSNKEFCCVIFRPATVCGYSARQRLDLSVNILTNYAFHKKEILVFGGNQLRPNLHIKDYIRVCKKLIRAPKDKIVNQIFNVGCENKTITKLSKIIANYVKKKYKKKVTIKILKSNDKRSYHINSDKIKKVLNFYPLYSIKNAISDLCEKFFNKSLKNTFKNINYFNIKKFQKLKIK